MLKKRTEMPEKVTQKTAELRASRYCMMCSRARRVACFHQLTNKKTNSTCLACLEELQESKHSWKKVVNTLFYLKDLFSSVIATFAGSSGDRIHTEMSCQIVVGDFVTLKILRFSHKLSSCLSDISL